MKKCDATLVSFGLGKLQKRANLESLCIPCVASLKAESGTRSSNLNLKLLNRRE